MRALCARCDRYYWIAAVHSRSHLQPLRLGGPGRPRRGHRGGFDSLVGEELSAFKARSLIIDVIGAR